MKIILPKPFALIFFGIFFIGFTGFVKAQVPCFSVAVNYASGGNATNRMTQGFFNGDANRDLVIANFSSSNISILLGTGGGAFGVATNFATGTNPFDIVAADFNNDGNMDVATSNSNGNNVSVLLGNGAGSFAAAVNYAAGSSPSGINITDVNGDGNTDIIVSNSAGNNVSVLIGSPTGTFAAPTNYAVGVAPQGIISDDFNNDGNPDIATTNSTGNNISILLGSPSGTFAAAVNYAVATTPRDLVTDDINGDGNLDIITANFFGNNLSVLMGSASGTFAAAVNYAVGNGPYDIVLGDFTNDGYLDIAAPLNNSNQVGVLPGSSLGTFGAATLFGVGSNPRGICSGDFNSDGALDLATANNTGNNTSVLLACTPSGAALNFDGVDDGVKRAIFTAQNQNLTLQAKVKITAATATNQCIVYNGDTGSNGYGLYVAAGSTSLNVLYGGIIFIPTGYSLTPGKWTSLSLVLGVNAFTVYADGVNTFTGSIANPNAPATGSFCIGANHTNFEVFNGSIDEVLFWNQVRNQCQIVDNLYSEIPTTAVGLLANYHFNQGVSNGVNTAVTTLTDATGSFNCTLNNFVLTGSSSNWVAPGAVISGYSLIPSPAADIALTGNGNGITLGSTTPTLSNHTDFGANSTRTFVIQNTGSGVLNIGLPIKITGGNAADFSISSPPSQTLGPSAFTSFVVTFNAGAVGTRSATLKINSSDCDEPVYDFVVKGDQTGAALDFDGTNDYITTPIDADVDVMPNTTWEAWVYPTSTVGADKFILTIGDGGLDRGISAFGGQFYVSMGSGYNAVAPFTINNWYHIAVSFNTSTNRVLVYINGLLEYEGFSNWTVGVGTSANNLKIGAAQTVPNFFWDGKIDEVRIWNTIRSQCEIQTFMNCEIPTSASGLVANYHFNQGFASLMNFGQTALNDASTNFNTGTLINFNLGIGSNSNWVAPGAVVSGFTTTSPPTASINVQGNGNNILNNSVSTSTTNFTDFGSATTRTYVIQNTAGAGVLNIGTPYLTGGNAVNFSVTVLPATTLAAAGSTSFVVTFSTGVAGTKTAVVNIPNNDCAKPNYNFVMSATPPAGEALSFDGVNDRVNTIDIQPSVLPVMTFEAWVYRTGGSGNQTIIGNDDGGWDRGLIIQSNSVTIWAGRDIITPFTSSLNTWEHYAVTWSATEVRCVKNGTLVFSTSGESPSSSLTQAGIGAVMSGWLFPFQGKIDEVRIWNTARTQCEVQTYMNAEITSTASGLIVNYHFNQGIAGLSNPSTTTAIDVSGLANTGTLSGFALSGLSSNWVIPGAVASGYTTTSAPTVSINLQGNGNNILNNAVTTTTNNFTDFGSASTRTFFIQNTAATGVLNITTPYLTGINVSEFSVTVLPSATVAALGSTSFVIAFTPTAGGLRSATVNIINNDCAKPIYNYRIDGTAPAGEALNFDGVNDLVNIAHNVAFNITNSLSIEAWINTSSSNERYITSKYDDSWYLAINGGGVSPGKASFYLNSVTPLTWLNGTTNVSDGNWHHIAATYDGLAMKIYVDGKLDAQAIKTGSFAITTGTNALQIGARSSNQLFLGSMDEFRLWNVARSQCQIQNFMNAEITSTASGLVANYHFNHGSAGLSNPTATTLIDAASALSGTLSSFSLTGLSSNWISPGGVVSGFTTALSQSATFSLTGNGNTVPQGVATTTTNNTDFGTNPSRTFSITNGSGSGTLHIQPIFFTGPNAAQFSVTTVPASSLTSGGSSFVITLTPTNTGVSTATVNIPSNDCTNPTYSFVITASTTPASALYFDGTSDYVNCGNILPPSYTKEAWIYLVSGSAHNNIMSGGAGAVGHAFYVPSSNGFRLNAGHNGTWNSVQDPTPLNFNTWYHVAVTYDGATGAMRLYKNGIQVAYNASVAAPTSSVVTIGWFDAVSFFKGSIDEVRLWNVVRSQCEIQTFKDCEIPSTAGGLIANYHFNQGVPSGSNSGVNTLIDATGTTTGTLMTFALTGTVSNWVTPGGVANGYSISTPPTATLLVNGNGNNILHGSVATSTTNFTDFGGATSRTYSAQNIGVSNLYINNVTFSGAAASQFSFTTSASNTITSGSSGTFAIVFTPTALGTQTAIVNINSNDCSNPTYSFVISASSPTASALSFDGTNDHILLANNVSSWNIGNNFTIETWLKPNSVASTQLLLYTGYGCIDCPAWALSIGPESTCGFSGGNSGRIVFMATDKTSTNAIVQSLANPTIGVWTHVAVTGNGSTLKMYVNGVLQSTAALTFTIPSSTFRNIGADPSVTGGCNIRYVYNGTMDELRFWNVARTQCEIQQFMSAEITSTASGLTANYHFNQGIPSGANATQTLLTDAAGVNTGTITNFALTGLTSNWVNPGGVISGFTTALSQPATFSLTGNGNNVPQGVVTTTTNNTDFGTNSSQTFSITNGSGSGTLHIQPIFFTGPNAAQFSVTTAPASTLTTGGTSFVITLTPTNTGVSIATVNVPSNDCTNPTYSFVITASTTPASALDFDGTSDVVQTGIDADTDVMPNTTWEAWVFPTTTAAGYRMVMAIDDGGWDRFLTLNGNEIRVATANGTEATVTTYAANQWYHLAVVYKQAGNQAFVYVNGIQFGPYTTAFSGAGITVNNFMIGANINYQNHFLGKIDEVRVWNTARTQCEIQTFMNAEITSTASGLVGNFHFNQGLPSGNNSAITTLTNAAGVSNGTLISFGLTGATSNWVIPGGVANGFTTTSAPTASIVVSGNGNNVPQSAVTTTLNNTDFGTNASRTFSISNASGTLNINPVFFTGPNAAQFSVTTAPVSSLTTGGTSFVITLTPTNTGISTATVNIPSNDCVNPTYTFVITASTTPASALSFDGTNDFVQANHTASIMPTNSITVEAWVNMNNTAGIQYLISKGTSDIALGHYGLYVNSGFAGFHLYQGSHVSAQSTTTISTGSWTHLAGTWDGNTLKMYVNGVLNGTQTLTGPLSINTGSLQIGRLGTPGFSYQTNGKIDEVRIWNTVRTQCEIQTFMNAEITSTASGLVANYHFNQGIPGGTNPTQTLLTDAAGANTGTVTNFALTGTVSNWVIPGGVANGFTTTSAPTASIVVSGNGNNVPQSAVTTTLNNTDFGTNASRTFSISNASGTLNINPIYFTGANAAQFSVTTVPASTIAVGGTSFVITLTPTNTGLSTATVNIPSNDCGNPTYSFVITASVTVPSSVCLNGVINYTAGTNPESITYGDFNGDGKNDIALLNDGQNNIAVYLNAGNGSFITAVNYSAGSNVRAITNADFNGDSYPDLAVTNLSGNNISVLLGSPSGTFAAAVNYNVGSQPFGIIAADFNNDGKKDIAVCNGGSNNVSILIGSGLGTFAAAVNYGVGTYPNHLVAADFNNDGNLDIVTANYSSNNISLLSGSAGGTFAAAVNYSTGTNPNSATSADFNADGKADLAISNAGSNNISVRLGTGTGNFNSAINYASGNDPYKIVSSDFNNDGKIDLAVCNQNGSSNNISMFMGAGYGLFGAANNYPVGANPFELVAADFNGDGKPDIATANFGSNNLSLLINGAYITAISSPTYLCVGNTATITASGATTYTWSNAANTSSITVSPVITTTYSVAGTNSNNCTGSTTVNLTVAPPTTILVSGNGTLIPNGSTSTSTNNFTDFGTNTTRTFVIQNTGTASLSIGTVSFTGANAAQYSVSVSPASSLAASASTSFTILFTPTATGASSAIVHIISSDCANPNYSFVITASTSPASALNFDGVNDYVEAANTSSLMLTNNVSIESWVKLNTISGIQYIVSKGPSDLTNGQYGLVVINGVPQFHFFNGGAHEGINYNYTLTPGVWTHLAGTWNGTTMNAYVNGIYNATGTYTGVLSANTGSIQIGRLSAGGYYLGGNIDELRIWNTPRTQCEIQTFMNAEITSTASGLVANYHFNQGIPSGSNSAVTTLTDAAAANTATLYSFALNGATSNWVSPGGVVNGFTTTAAPTVTISVSGNGNPITDGSILTTTLNNTSFTAAGSKTFVISNGASGTLNIGTPYFTGTGASLFSLTTLPAASLAPSGTTSFVIAFTPTAAGTQSATVNINNNDCNIPVFDYVIQGTPASGEALHFDGINDQVALPAMNFTSTGVTLEGWFYSDGVQVNALAGLIFHRGCGSCGLTSGLHTSGGLISYHWNDLFYGGGAPYPINTWFHAALVVEPTRATIYINGVPSYVNPIPHAAQAFAGTTLLGRDSEPCCGSRRFKGKMDEIRLWNKALTPCEIQTSMNAEITTTASGLVANYHFNQGAAALSNSTVTTLTDASGNGKTGTLANFALTGTVSNWVAPGGVVSGFTTTIAPTASISVSGNGNNIPQGIVTNTSNNTDFGTNSSRTFSISNASGTLNINPILFTGQNAAQFSVTTVPASSLTVGGTSFVILHTPTVAGTASAIVNITSNDCTNPTYSFVITASTSPASALNFEGINDFVSIPTNTSIPVGNSPYTIESWIKPNNFGTYGIVGWGNYGNTNQTTALRLDPGGFIIHYWWGNDLIVSAPTLTNGNWHHVAATFDGITRAIYVDGVMLASDTPNGHAVPNNANMRIGSTCPGVCGGEFFNGSIDEVRIWNVARTQCQLQTFMGAEITTTASGLVANYHFNQGIPSGANATQTLLIDAASANTGTLNGFALTSSISNWVSPGGVTNGFTTTTAPTASIVVSGNGNNVPQSAVTTTLNNTDFGTNPSRTFSISNTSGTLNINPIYFTGPNAAQFSVTTAPATSLAVGGTSFVITLTPTNTGISTATVNIPSNDCTNPTYSFVITASTSAAGALSFDGTSDYVVTTNTLTPSYTKEAWINISNASAVNNIVSHGSGTVGAAFWAPSNILSAGHNNTWNFVSDATPLNTNTWYHVAVSYDASNSTMRLYKNGILVSSNYTVPPFTGNQNVLLGSFIGANLFEGKMDEVRIWNTVRTQCEIQTFMSAEITSTASGLVANYHFNQGIPSGSNIAVTTLTDAAGANTGTLVSFALTGSTSNWVSPGSVINGFTTTSAPTASIVVSGNGNNVPQSAVTTTLNNTDFGTNTSRTFSISNASGTLNINPIFFTGPNAAQFSVTTVPAGSLLAGGGTSLVITLTPTNVGVSTATVHIPSNDCTNPTYSFVITASTSAASALKFDGVNDIITINSSPSFSAGASADFTGEAWIKYPGNVNQGAGIILMRGSNYNAQLVYSAASVEGHIWSSLGTHYSQNAFTVVNDNNWHHLAMVIKGSDKSMKVYVDGLLKLSETATVLTGAVNTCTEVILGTENGGNVYFPGTLDEVRIWNTARTQCQIQTFMNAEITGTATGLMANYHFNQGVPSGPNLAVTTLTDAANANTGTLTGFALTTGSVSNWISPGAIANGFTTTTAQPATFSITGNGNNVPMGVVTATANNTDFGTNTSKTFSITNGSGSGTLHIHPVYFTGPNASQFNITTAPVSSLTGGGTSFVITLTPTNTGISTATVNIPSNDCTNPTYSFVITASTSPASALDFDNNNDYVNLGPGLSTLFDPLNNITLEAWVKPTSTVGLGSIVGNWQSPGSFMQFLLQRNGNSYMLHIDGGPGYLSLQSAPNTVTLNTWQHVAGVWDGAQMRLYINGVLQGVMANTGANFASNINNVLIGGNNVNEQLTGAIDEVRIWTVPRTQCQIQSFMNAEITTTASGLVANYHFNQGIPSGPNLAVTILTDATGSYNGTLTNMGLTTGSISNWVSPGGVISGSTTPATVSATISVSGNANPILNGSTTPTVTNHTDFAGAATRTFVVTNTGTTALHVGRPYLTGVNASEFSVGVAANATVIAPSASLAFVVAFTPTSSGVKNATVNILNNDCGTPLHNFAIRGTPPPAEALSFDGGNDYLNGPLVTAATNSVTLEAKVYYNGSTGFHHTILQHGSSGYGLALQAGTGRLGMYIGGAPLAITNYTIPFQQWTSISAVILNNIVSFYANGILVGTLPYVSTPVITGSLVVGGGPGDHLRGNLDEIRIWDKALTQCEIQTYLNCEIPGALPNLKANYHFNQGSANLANPTTTLVLDASGNNYSLTANNFAMTGTVSNWVNPGAVASGFTTTSAPNLTVSVSGNGNPIIAGSSVPTASNNTAFGSICIGTPSVTKTFSIQNSGPSVLNINTIKINGASNFTVGAFSPSIASGAGSTFQITYSSPTVAVHNATVIINTNDCNTPDYSYAITASLNALPSITANATSTQVCNGNTVTLTGTGANTYTWTGGVTNAVSFTPAASSSYTVSGTNTLTGCSSTASIALVVNPLPTVSIIGTNTICALATTNFTASGALSYSWLTTGITTASIALSPSVTTVYTVTGTDVNGCQANATATLTVFANPTITVNSGSICAGQVFTMVPGGANTYTFSNGSATVSPPATSSYSVMGTSTAGCVSTVAAVCNLTVNNNPTITVTSGVICQGDAFVIIPGGAATYTYSGGSATVSPLVNTSYSVTGTSTAGCISQTAAIVNITVNPTPTITVNSGTICEASNFTINPSGAISYTFSGGSAVVSPTVTTSYSVTGTNTFGCVSSTAAVSTVTVFALPQITVSSGAICSGQSFTINPSGAATYTYSGGNAVVTPSTTTSYTINGSSIAGCSNAVPAICTVTVDLTPSITVSSGTICYGQSFTLNPGGANTYTYSGGSAVVNPTSTTSYTVSGTSLAGCASTVAASATITVNGLPTITANASQTLVCEGSTVILNATGANTYTWSNGITNNGSFTATSTANYTVNGTDNNGCENSATVAVAVNPLPTLSVISSNTTTCNGETVTLTVSGADTYTWAGIAVSASVVVVTPTDNTTYTVSGSDSNGCINLAVFTQSVSPCSGTIDARTALTDVSCRGKNDGKIVITDSTRFKNRIVRYVWTPQSLCPDSTCSTIDKLKGGDYTVKIKVKYLFTGTFTKEDSIVRTYTIKDENAPCDLKIFNAFTPNSDGVNEVFEIENIELYPNNKVSIFNRWGTAVTEINGYNNKNKSWPSKAELDKLTGSTYFYVIDLGDGGKPVKGWVEVIKQ